MELTEAIGNIELFEGLTDNEIEKLVQISTSRTLKKGQMIVTQGETSDELYIITDGFVEVLLGEAGDKPARVVVNLGAGQIVGEMALVDHGPRSATVRAISDPTIVHIIRRRDFDVLCEENTRIGYIVMRNIAADLSFKVRHRNLSESR